MESIKRVAEESSYPFLTSLMFSAERLRVASQVRNEHLDKAGNLTEVDKEILREISKFEKYIDSAVGKAFKLHPTYPWWRWVKGCGMESVPKVLGLFRITPTENKPNYARTISSLWKFAGLYVENGKSPKPIPGEKLPYNNKLRMASWRLAKWLIMASGSYYSFYLLTKGKELSKAMEAGLTVLPYIEDQKRPNIPTLPRAFKEAHGERITPEITKDPIPYGFISEGHIHGRAIRKVQKLFLAHLMTIWCNAIGREISKPYSISILGHEGYLDPWDMIDSVQAPVEYKRNSAWFAGYGAQEMEYRRNSVLGKMQRANQPRGEIKQILKRQGKDHFVEAIKRKEDKP